MGSSLTSRRRKAKVVTLDELVEVCKQLTGNRKHDWEIGEKAGISHVHTDVLRNLLGKIQYSAVDISPEAKEEIVDCYTRGMPIQEIADKFHFKNTSYIYRIVKMMGYDVDRANSWSPIKTSRLLSLKDSSKYTWDQIANLLAKTKYGCIYKYNHIKNTCSTMQDYLEQHVKFGSVLVKYDNVYGLCAKCNGYIVKLQNIPMKLKDGEEITKESWVKLSTNKPRD